MVTEFHVGDLHFGHKNIVKFDWDHRGFPLRTRQDMLEAGMFPRFESVREHDQYVIEEWNKTVRDGDIVWVHGDVAFNREVLSYVQRLKGDKRLIGGNHDHFPTRAYLDAGFTKIYSAVERHGCILTHIPVHPSQLTRWPVNIHGHTHQDRVRALEPVYVPLEELDKDLRPYFAPPGSSVFEDRRFDRRYVCVSLEQTRMRPIAWEELEALYPAIRELQEARELRSGIS